MDSQHALNAKTGKWGDASPVKEIIAQISGLVKTLDYSSLTKELLEIKLIANVDCDALARLLIAQEQYLEITEQIRETPLMLDVPVYETQKNPDTGKDERVQVGTKQVVNGERERLMIIQDRCMKQCRQGASDFGMTVSSRCRLAVPKPKDEKPENKFAKYAN